MKYIVNVANQQYEVEIEDIHARPVIARVEGQVFEVTPESEAKPESPKTPREFKPLEPIKHSSGSNASVNELTAPLPGTVIEVFVKNEDQIESGQVVLIIEAMKMKNSIRSTRTGKIAQVLVSAGQTVAHKQPLLKFAD